MQDQINEEPPLTSTPTRVTPPSSPAARSMAARVRSPFLGCAAERVVRAHYRNSDARRRQSGERLHYRVLGADPRISLAAVSAQQFHDHPDEASAGVGVLMAMGMVSMTKKERASYVFLARKCEFHFYIRTIHELMPQIEAEAGNMWIDALQDGGSQ